jgi:hypothetical protein
MLLKIIGLGPRAYISNGLHSFDAFDVFIET